MAGPLERRRPEEAKVSTADPAETTIGARALYETLRACGVTHLFGLDSPEPLYAELDRAEMRLIAVREERAVTGQVFYVEGGWLL